MNKKILCVDDEPNVLYGYKRSLRRDYDIHIAEGGPAALKMITTEGPFAVVVSDMRMPVMDGIQLLSRVKQAAPESVRVMLTGNADQQTAMDAVNEGSIFRFLTKPCAPERLAATLDAALEQHRLITAEKDLLGETLNGSLQVMVDILSMVNPTAFSRSTRVKKIAHDIASELSVDQVWEVEFAAMLSQIGCIAVPEEVLHKVASGSALDPKEAGLYHQFPQTGGDLISRIPRMEAVAEMIANQNRRINDEDPAAPGADGNGSSVIGARILKVVLDFDKLINSGNSPTNAFTELKRRSGWYDETVLATLRNVIALDDVSYESIEVRVAELEPGMILDQPLFSSRGQVLLAAGQEVTMSLILRLGSLVQVGLIADSLQVLVPARQGKPALSAPIA